MKKKSILFLLLILIPLCSCDPLGFTPWEHPEPEGYTTGIFTLSFSPDKSEKALIELINDARESIYVALYGFDNENIEEALLEAWWHRNIDLQMITEYDAEDEGGWENMIEAGSWPYERGFPVHMRNTGGIMHNKYFIVDGRYVVTGSTNLTQGMLKHFNNLIIIDSPTLAEDYLRDFRVLQNSVSYSEKDEVYDELYPEDENWVERIHNVGDFIIQPYFTPYRETFPSYHYETGIEYLYYNFDKALYEVANIKNALNVIVPLLENAQESITIYTFAFTDRLIMDRLIKAHERGVEVKVFMDYKMLRSAFRYAGDSYIELTRRIGNVKICRKADGGLLHHKVIMVDDEHLILGSLNFSNNAVTKNDENFIHIQNAAPLIHAFEQEAARIEQYSYFLPEADEFSGYFDEFGDPNYGSY